ncbi:unnamed protein product [Paramecium pentaurelia]|uniref:Auxin efflux carrier n=1 Tax=Paramecium pentaurelia TaxID=43138 RepID=A0A8S1WUJ7_9CILI|nr:unnamed protein product [Paramecium pentaurelia]
MIFINIIRAVVSATFGVLAIAGSGALLTHNKVMNKQFTTTLSSLVERLFLPSLIFTNFLKAVTIGSLVSLIPSIITTFCCLFFGYCIGIVSNRFWIKEKKLNSIVILSSANPHTTNIQLQLSYGLTSYLSKMTEQPEKQIEVKLVTIIIIQTVIVNALRWSIGKRILEQHETDQNQAEIELSDLRIALPEQQSQNKNEQKSEKSFWNMPLISVLASLCCLVIYPIQDELVNDTFLHSAIFLPLQTISKATTPSVLMILGSNLYLIYFNNSSQQEKISTIIQIVANRLIFLPFLGLITILLLDKLSIMTDVCQLFILFITFCTPSAINILVMAKQYQQNAEDVVSLILLYGYLGCIFTLPIWMTIYLAIFQNT